MKLALTRKHSRILHFGLLASSVALLSACVSQSPKKPPLTSLDKQNIQTRQYQSTKNIVFASVISALQDLGYIINSANLDTGFVNASSPQTKTSSFGSEFFLGETKQEKIKMTGFIEEIGQTVRVRLSFVRTTFLSTYESSLDDDRVFERNTNTDKPIYDRKMYQKIFNMVEEGIFLRTPSTTPATGSGAGNADKESEVITPTVEPKNNP